MGQLNSIKNTIEREIMEESKVSTENPLGLDGLEFIEFATPNPIELERLFYRLGFRMVAKHKKKNVFLFEQGRTKFILNRESNSFSQKFFDDHGPSVCATGFRVANANQAFEIALSRGATAFADDQSHSFKTISGIGDSAVYFVDKNEGVEKDFEYFEAGVATQGFSLEIIDHMTNNVPKNAMDEWCDFYERIFNFKEVRYFDIKGEATGLVSKVMRSPDGKITIPINEPTEDKSQIQEYLDEYNGSGIQHIALLTNDIISTVSDLRKQGVEFLDVPDTYYEALKERLPIVEENIDKLKELKILVDGDEDGYLLQIFTKNMIGPIFFEIIQRKNHSGFGEGNFQALFDAIERDQRRRGYL